MCGTFDNKVMKSKPFLNGHHWFAFCSCLNVVVLFAIVQLL